MLTKWCKQILYSFTAFRKNDKFHCVSFCVGYNIKKFFPHREQNSPIMRVALYFFTNFFLLVYGRHGSHRDKRGSYMSAPVLLNLSNELRKSDKMRYLPSLLSLFGNEFNKFNNT